MADELKMLEELEAVYNKALDFPIGENSGKFWCSALERIPTLICIARRGLEADALAQRAERAEAALSRARTAMNEAAKACDRCGLIVYADNLRDALSPAPPDAGGAA